ncbi:hypothetical protein FVEN_g8695 [Fusarium venenatum]|uniref:Uncharacterized protein n=1 Tax=Fusarium venenatum TaxID=56646 RepID=A0A2L2T2R9_9HYPO|nr:uncharacterized protein FVRRES_12170 [Fusarium venenatum]KAG8353314.1 hypothetical protein FVEN_g8695 [Fusarium venenatum]KAH6978805.1 hypothetical protein EDB82DRAFT_577114 [Fusarium venenatum]CEI39479.1 unnamed protein product [Fusarium venenatum]
MPRLKANAAKNHVVDFTDHAGRPAKMAWCAQPEETIPPLTSWCFYFVHPDFSLDELDTRRLRHDIQEGYGDRMRYELFCIPGGSRADCAQHYREELESRGDDFEQVREAERAEKDPEYAAVRGSRGKLPGLPASQRYPGNMSYHHFVCIYKDPTWNHDSDEMEIDVVEFDPALTDEDYEPGERIYPQDPMVTTRVSAKYRKEDQTSEGQDLWGWFLNSRSPDWYHSTVSATSIARELGWASW